MRFKSAFLIFITVILNVLCLAQTPAPASASPVTSSPAEALVQDALLLSTLDQQASIPSAISAPPRRGRKGVVKVVSLLNSSEQTVPVPGEVSEKNVDASSKEPPVSATDSEATKKTEDFRAEVSEPVMIRFNSPGSEAYSADHTASLRYQFVTTSRPRSRFAFLKAIFPKRLKRIWHRSPPETAGLHQSSDTSTAILTTVSQSPVHLCRHQVDPGRLSLPFPTLSVPQSSSINLRSPVCRSFAQTV